MTSINDLSRRRVLRGMMGGAAVTVGMPLLDCFLDVNGTAMANGAPVPFVYGSWFAGLGLSPTFWEPKATGAKYEISEQLKPLAPFRDKLNIYSGLQVMLDGKPNSAHTSGPQGCLTGDVPRGAAAELQTIDSLVSDVIGTRSRFRSLEVSCDGTRGSYSWRGGNVVNPSEVSPVALYSRVFGPEFKDPNAANFTADPHILARRSALSVVSEERGAIMKTLGTVDRVRLDEYFTSVRELEKQLDIASEKPAPMESCRVADKVSELEPGAEVNVARQNHRLFAKLLAHALACGQTRVINIVFTTGTSVLRRGGESQGFHMLTHEESIDPKLGYQPTVYWFQNHVVSAYAECLGILDGFKEGAGTLLDRCLIQYSTDSGSARVHATDNIPQFTAGSAGGRVKTGIHVNAQGDTVARVGLTIQQAMGVQTAAWGTESNKTSRAFTEVLA